MSGRVTTVVVPSFADAAAALADIACSPGGRLTRAQLGVVRHQLHRLHLVRQCGADADDVVSDAIVRFVGAAAQGRLVGAANPAGYLVRTAENTARTHLSRVAGRAVAADDTGERADPAAEQPVAGIESRAVLEQLMSRFVVARDLTAQRVLAAVADLAADGATPSVRDIARYAGASIGTTHRALRRIRSVAGDLA